MIETGLKCLLIILLALIFWQDHKQRLVFWFLYPLSGLCVFVLQVNNISVAMAIMNTVLNLMVVALLIGISWLYARVVMKRRYLNESIGTGDLLFFGFLAFGFATITFIVLLIFSLVFALLLHAFYGHRQTDKTVPLAGYMALFFAVVYLVSFFTEPKYLFSY